MDLVYLTVTVSARLSHALNQNYSYRAQASENWKQTVGGTFFFTRGSSASPSSLLSAPLETVNVNRQQSSFTCMNHELSDIMTELLTISNRTMSNNDQHKPIAIDWIEQCFTSQPTQYKLYERWFLQEGPNQQYQSTEGTNSTQTNQTYNKQTRTQNTASPKVYTNVGWLGDGSRPEWQWGYCRGTPKPTANMIMYRYYIPILLMHLSHLRTLLKTKLISCIC